MLTQENAILFAVVALAAATGVATYGFLVTRYGERFALLGESAAGFNSPAQF